MLVQFHIWVYSVTCLHFTSNAIHDFKGSITFLMVRNEFSSTQQWKTTILRVFKGGEGGPTPITHKLAMTVSKGIK